MKIHFCKYSFILCNRYQRSFMKFFLFFLIFFLSSCSCLNRPDCARGVDMSTEIVTISDVQKLMTNTVAHVDQIITEIKARVPHMVRAIIAVPDAQRTFANTAQALDDLNRFIGIQASVLAILKEVSPDAQVRTAAHDAIVQLQPFVQEEVAKNIALFKAFKAYTDGPAQSEQLTTIERYFIQETMRAYKRGGLLLPEEQLARVKKLSTQLAKLELAFSANIANVTTKLPFEHQQLAGVPATVLANLKKDDQGRYLVGLDYATVYPLLAHATDESTRKTVFLAFENRAYPENYTLLEQIIALRGELARVLGFANYAVYDLDDQMAKNPTRVQEFFDKLIGPAREKQAREWCELTAQLPDSVQLTPDGKFKPWDVWYVKEQYRQKHFNLNGALVAEYFPVRHVLKEVFNIYQKFLGLKFEQLSCSGFWHESVQCIAVHNANDHALRGYLLLDLYPRPNKYSHACMAAIVPAQQKHDGSLRPAVIAILANFPTPTQEHPGLLRFEEVNTFFHEFGHAMHAVVGATPLSAFSGTSVKEDFVETPSQMFEQWLKDYAVVRTMSKHYKTGQPLPSDLINILVKIDKFDIGDFVLRQLALSQLSMAYFMGGVVDVQALYKHMVTSMRPYVLFVDDMHMPASWGHVASIGYGSKYYVYLWAKVYALDLFSVIQREGLLNPQIGARLVHSILGRGGSADPSELLRDFLGREPNPEAFIQYMLS